MPSYRKGLTRYQAYDPNGVTLGLQVLLAYHGPLRADPAVEAATLDALLGVLNDSLRQALAGQVVARSVLLTWHYARVSDDGLRLRLSWYVDTTAPVADYVLAHWPYADLVPVRVFDGVPFDEPQIITDALVWQEDAAGNRTLVDNGTLSARLYPILERSWK